MNQPLFSVITVTYNAAPVLMPTLESVRKQSYENYEYIVVDGNSEDGTLRLVRGAGIPNTHIVSEADKGIYDAMNKAMDMAQGDYLIFLNAGDSFADATVLQRMAAVAGSKPGVIYGQTMIVDDERKVMGPRHLTAPAVLTAKSFKDGMLVCHQAFAARRELAPKYDLKYRLSSDYDWCLKILKKSAQNAYVGDEPIIHFLSQGMTHDHHGESLWERYVIMCKHFGWCSATLRHVGFAFRAMGRKFKK